MSLDTTVGGASAESYASVLEADTYHSNRGNTAWTALATPAKEQALRKATDYLTQIYRERWKGYRVNNTQALDWPRLNAGINDGGIINFVPQDHIPIELKNACCELALKSTAEDLNPDIEREIISESIDGLSVDYAPGSKQSKTFTAVDMMLRPLLKTYGSTISLMRS